MKIKRFIAITYLLLGSLVFTGCSSNGAPGEIAEDTTISESNVGQDFSFPCPIDYNSNITWHMNDNTLVIKGYGPLYGGTASTGLAFRYNREVLGLMRYLEMYGEISYISAYAFSYLPLEIATIHAPVLEVGMGLFQASEVVSVDMRSTAIKNIPMECFMNCHSLTSVYLPQTIETIESGAFENCKKLAVIYYDGDWNSINIEPQGNDILAEVEIKPYIE